MTGIQRDDRNSERTRVVVLCTEFWPLGAGAHEAAAEATAWVRSIQRLGMDVTVWTPRHHSSWPYEVTLNSIPVLRPATAPVGHWSHFRYLQSVSHWLNDHAAGFDHVVVFGLTEEAIAVAQWAEQHEASLDPAGGKPKRRIRTTAVATGWFQDADTAEWSKNRRIDRRLRRAISQMDTVVTGNAWMDRQLLTAGVPSDRIVRIPGWDSLTLDQESFVDADRLSRRRAARKALSEINRDLAAELDAPVVLWVGPMERQQAEGRPSGLRLMVESARILLRRYPDLRIWLVGDGPGRDWAHTELRAEGVRSSVAMPGTFTEIHELIDAVDVAIYSEPCQLRFSINQMVAAGVPFVASRDEAFESHFQLDHADAPLDPAGWYNASTAKTFRQSMRVVLDDLDSARARAKGFAEWSKRLSGAGQRSDQWGRLLRGEPNSDSRLGSVTRNQSESRRYHA